MDVSSNRQTGGTNPRHKTLAIHPRTLPPAQGNGLVTPEKCRQFIEMGPYRPQNTPLVASPPPPRWTSQVATPRHLLTVQPLGQVFPRIGDRFPPAQSIILRFPPNPLPETRPCF